MSAAGLLNHIIKDGTIMPWESEIERLVLILTSQCNLQCRYCYQTAKRALTMDQSTLRASLDLALTSSSSKIELLFVGGEPLLEWPLILEAVSYVSQNAPSGKHLGFEISTNGLLMTEEMAAFLDQHKFKIQLSLDGIESAQNFRGKGTFSFLDHLLDRLRENRSSLFTSRLRVSTVQIPSTIPYFADSIQYLIRKEVCEIGISPSITPSPGWRMGSIQELDSQFSRIYRDSLNHFEQTGEVPLEFFRKYKNQSERTMEGHFRCGAETGKTIVVDTDGQVYGCVMFAESYQKFASERLESCLAPLRMGHFRDKEFVARRAAYDLAVRGAAIFTEREHRFSSYGKCSQCSHFDGCSVCPVSTAYDSTNSDLRHVPDFICAFNQVALKYHRQFPCIPDPLEKLNRTLRKLAAMSSAGAHA